MFEIEPCAPWELPLIVLAFPFIVVAIACGTIAAVLTGSFTFKLPLWR